MNGCGLNLYFLITNEVGHVPCVHWPLMFSLVWSVCSSLLLILFLLCDWSFSQGFIGILCIFSVEILWQLHVLQILSPSLWLVFSLSLWCHFTNQKYISLIKYQSFETWCFYKHLRNSFLTKGQKNILSQIFSFKSCILLSFTFKSLI